MQKLSLGRAAGLIALLIAGLYGCKKSGGINNNQVIETAYSLYFSDTAGALFNTNDGRTVKVVYAPDGQPCRAICTFGSSLLWAKDNLYVSLNSGKTFNHTYDSLLSLKRYACNGLPVNLNQSMMLDLQDWGRVYAPSNADPGSATQFNYLGLVYNDSLGVRGKWTLDVAYDSLRVGILPVRMTSLTRLANGVVCGLAFDADPTNPDSSQTRNFYRACKDCVWRETTANPTTYANLPMYNTGGNPLPQPLTGANPNYFTLGHFNNRLIAIDSKCEYGGWYSDDTGLNWYQCPGLPTIPLLCIASPFEQICLVGTDGAGLYVYNSNTGIFEQNLNGLASNLKIRSIAAKEDVFKNKTSRRYVYLATDKGMFQSTDGGHNWVLTAPGNYIACY